VKDKKMYFVTALNENFCYFRLQYLAGKDLVDGSARYLLVSQEKPASLLTALRNTPHPTYFLHHILHCFKSTTELLDDINFPDPWREKHHS
jgi:hypothetical protein